MAAHPIKRLSGKLVGTSMRSKDLAKADGLAVVFDHSKVLQNGDI